MTTLTNYQRKQSCYRLLKNNENNEITRQAERFAETRGPFSQYVPHFTSNVNEIEVIKQLVKYTKDTDNFDLQIAAYRKSQVCPDNEYNILLFVETTESFAYLLNTDKWLPQLDNKTYQLKTPSILLQLSAVIQNVGFDIDIDEFSENVKELYPEIVNLVRLKNRAQRNFKTDKDGEKAEHLLDWAVSQSLAAITPNCPTSLRSDREINYVLVTGVQLTVQAYTGNTTRDHKPIFSVLAYENTKNSIGCLTYWKVFYFFLSQTHVYWETRWADKKFNENYDKLNQFLILLVERCTRYFPIEMARGAIPKELR
ncbi:unnamed protein product, partial [Didymodactylos carnosus]